MGGVSILAPTPAPRHRAPSPPLSRSTWQRVRLTLTAGLFAAATVTGVVVGLQGAAVSPVAAAAPAPGASASAPAVPAPVVNGVPPVHHDRGPHR